jgi:hypothetical protein
MRIDSSGRLLVGTTTARTNLFNTTIPAQIQSENVGNTAVEYLATRVSNDTTGSSMCLAKARGASAGSVTITQSGDQLGSLNYLGSDGSEFVEAARIEAFVDGTPGANDMPGRLVFSTTADGASSPTERMRIDSSGRLLVGTSSNSGGATIQASGSVQASLALRFPANSRNGGTTRATAIETISTDGGTNTATIYADSRYGAGKWVFLAGFDSSGNAINSTTSTGPASTFVFCITDAAANFPTT